MLATLLAGESLFNDASSIVLFEIFLKLAMGSGASGSVMALPGLRSGAAGDSLTALCATVAGEVAWLSGAGVLGGLVAGVCTR
jgi:NhaP-type Na+/H+ or K+/H+ antiporter